MYSESLQDGRNFTHEQFRVEVASGLLLQAGMSERDKEESFQYTDTIPQPLRLVGKHFPTHLPPCSSGRSRQSVCAVCSGKKGRKKVTSCYQCKACKVAMCIEPCFELYHTKTDPTCYLPVIS